MPELSDIKDRTPNQDTIRVLEELLEHAKSGELRTVLWMAAWDDDAVSHGWSLDRRNDRRRILSEMVLLQNDILTNQALEDGDSVLSRCFDID